RSSQVILLDLARPRRRLRQVKDGNMYTAAISPDGRWAATGTWNGYWCKVRDARTGRCLQEFPARNARTAFSPDSRWLVIGHLEKYEFHRLDGDRWGREPIRSVPRDKGASSAGLIAFTRDARMAALTHSVRSIRFLDTQAWREVATIAAPDSEEMTWLCLTPPGPPLPAPPTHWAIPLPHLRPN